MSEIFKFIKLDFITFRNAVGLKILVLLLLIIGLYIFGGLIVLAGMLPMILPVLITQNFGAGNDGLDLFYASLHLKRESVVLGRYTFIILTNVIIFVLLFALSFLETGGLEPQLFLMQILLILFLTTTIDFFNAPFLFRLGFKKGRIVAQILPMILMISVFAYFHFSGITMDNNPDNLMNYVQVPEFNPLVMFVVWVVLLVISISLSLKFYTKRELG